MKIDVIDSSNWLIRFGSWVRWMLFIKTLVVLSTSVRGKFGDKIGMRYDLRLCGVSTVFILKGNRS